MSYFNLEGYRVAYQEKIKSISYEDCVKGYKRGRELRWNHAVVALSWFPMSFSRTDLNWALVLLYAKQRAQ